MRSLLPFLLASFAAAKAQTAVVKHGFETDTEGWMVMGANSMVKISNEAKTGAGALQFSYSLDGKDGSTAILPVGAGRLSDMRRVRFWVKSDHDAPLGVVLSEKKPGGGDYTAAIWAPKGVWQRVDLTMPDFLANDGASDPVDADGKLDPDQVEGIAILDLSAFFNQISDGSPMFVAKRKGAHTLLVDDFEILNDPAVKPGGFLLDTFDRGFSSWITLGGMRLSLAAPGGDNPLDGPALTSTIEAVDGKLTIMLRRVNGMELAGGKRLTFDIAADHEGTLSISIETRKPGREGGQGSRYNFLINPPGGRKSFRVNVSLADFEHDENSPADPAGKLEASRIQSIAIADISALTGSVGGRDNKIWIGRMEMVK